MSDDDSYGIYKYREPLIANEIDNYENQTHREKAYRRDHHLRIYITKLDEEIFTELPIFKPDILNSLKPNEPEREQPQQQQSNGFDEAEVIPLEDSSEKNDEIINDWQNERWSALWTKIFDMARVHRWCIATLYNEYPWWNVYGPIEVKHVEYSESGEPLWADIMCFKHLPYSDTALLKFDEQVKFGEDQPSLYIHYGMPEGKFMDSDDIEHIWDLSVELRYIKNDIIRNSAKSSGFYFMKLGKGSNPTREAKIEATMQKANYGNIVAAGENLITDIVDIHPENAQFSIDAYILILKAFAGACRLPLSFFNSESEQTNMFSVSGPQEDILVNKKKKFIFGQFKSAIIKLVEKRWGVVCEDVFPNLEEYKEETYKMDVIGENKNENTKTIKEETQNV